MSQPAVEKDGAIMAAAAADVAPANDGALAAAPRVELPPTRNLAPARPWYREPCMLGIDEAGRGPVLGAMVYAVALAPLSYADELAKKSYADSKTLSEHERARLFRLLSADGRCAYAADLLSAADISAAMLARHRTSLNVVAELSTIGLIQAAIDAGVDVAAVYVDTVGDADRYRDRLTRAFPQLVGRFTVCPKADAKFPIVSAASIVAKVLRDTSLLVERDNLPPHRRGAPLGNGYPSDASTQAWLVSNCDAVFGFPPLVRFSWETAVRVLDDRAARVAWPGDDAADGGGAGGGAGGGGGGGGGNAGGQQQTLACFRQPGDNAGETSGLGRHAFFRVRRMQRVVAF